jgi:hypothetical protein
MFCIYLKPVHAHHHAGNPTNIIVAQVSRLCIREAIAYVQKDAQSMHKWQTSNSSRS